MHNMQSNKNNFVELLGVCLSRHDKMLTFFFLKTSLKTEPGGVGVTHASALV